ncbi:MAG: 50S ribosomal protein L35 [Ruminococcus sp.]|nr:50S ribosomal protein L35 [Ruminococcus sp.]MBQ8906678.1 50S ribosomal protein L35 [Ruminococcus sp.]
MAKVKVKTHSGAKKRFTVTGSGKVKFQHTNKRHRLTAKPHKQKRIARNAGVAGATNAPTVKKLIPYA